MATQEIMSSGQFEELAIKSAEGTGTRVILGKLHEHLANMLLEALLLD